MPVLWIALTNYSADLKKKKMMKEIIKKKVGAAYIPLTAEMLAKP